MIIRIVYALFFAAVVFPALLLVQFGAVGVARIYATALVAFAIMLTGIELARVISEHRRSTFFPRAECGRRHRGSCYLNYTWRGYRCKR